MQVSKSAEGLQHFVKLEPHAAWLQSRKLTPTTDYAYVCFQNLSLKCSQCRQCNAPAEQERGDTASAYKAAGCGCYIVPAVIVIFRTWLPGLLKQLQPIPSPCSQATHVVWLDLQLPKPCSARAAAAAAAGPCTCDLPKLSQITNSMLHPAVPRNPLPTPTIKSCLAHQPRALLQGPTPPSAGLMPLSGVGLGVVAAAAAPRQTLAL
eukprot:1161511-Pelagomonas_calceolata.AAC.6